MDDLLEELETFFKDRGYLWNYDDEYRVPDAHDLKRGLDKMAGSLYGSKDGSHIEVGHLILVKDDEGFIVYAHIGEMK